MINTEKRQTNATAAEQNPRFAVWRNPNPVIHLTTIAKRYQELLALHERTSTQLNAISSEMRECAELMNRQIYGIGKQLKFV